MYKIELNNNCKRILLLLKRDCEYMIRDNDNEDINILIILDLIQATKLIGDKYCAPILTEKGHAYIHWNPKLKNPSIWDDKKYWITTSIAILSLILSIIAIIKSIWIN